MWLEKMFFSEPNNHFERNTRISVGINCVTNKENLFLTFPLHVYMFPPIKFHQILQDLWNVSR